MELEKYYNTEISIGYKLFTPRHIIGSGGQAWVELAYKNGKPYAIKFYSYKSYDPLYIDKVKQNVQDEYDFMIELQSDPLFSISYIIKDIFVLVYYFY